MNYNELLKELNAKRRDLQFSPKDLDSLSDIERKTIENELILLIKRGVRTSYKYIPYIKSLDARKELSYIENLPFEDKLDIYRYLYIRTKDKTYLDSIILSALTNNEAFSLLLEMLYTNEELLNIVLSVIKYTKNYRYQEMFKSIIDEKFKNIDILKRYNELNPSDFIPNSSLNSSEPFLGIGDKVKNQEELDKDYKLYLEKKNLFENVLSGLIGFSIGDALGVPVEFTSREERNKNPIKEMKGYGTYNEPEGTWSDDTSMTIATIDSIIKNNEINYDDIMSNFLLWCLDAKYTATNKVFDIGITTSNALNNYKYKGLKATECGSLEFNQNGNGSLMRMLPIVFYLFVSKLDEEEKIKVINDVSSLTHAHEISRLGCKIYSDYILRLLINNYDKADAYNYIRNIDYTKVYSKESVEVYKRILQNDISKLPLQDIKSNGYIVNTLEACLYVILTTNSYEEAMIKAVNLGEDTDTIGAISGSIAGIIYKYKTFPERWLNKLKCKDYLVNLAMKYAICLDNIKKKELNIQGKIK